MIMSYTDKLKEEFKKETGLLYVGNIYEYAEWLETRLFKIEQK